MITCKSEREMDYMRDAGKLVALTHQEVAKAVKQDVTTKELDTICEDYIVKHGGKPAFKGLYGFPATICASVNEEVVHGIPGLRKLINGDIISIDLGAEINGYYGDATQSWPVGEVSDEALRLLQVTEQSMYQGIDQAIVGNRLSDISHAVQEYAESNGFSVVKDYVGHGIGSKLHEDPQVPNYGHPGRGPRLKQGMTLAIEPMINVGTHEVQTLPNKWTVVTRDRKLSAHFEHTIAITDDVPEILTRL